MHLFRQRRQFLLIGLFRLLFAREPDASEACALAGRPGRYDQSKPLHLLARGNVLVVKVGAVGDFERNGAKPAKTAIDGVLALAKSLLDVRPVASTTERLLVSQRRLLHDYCF